MLPVGPPGYFCIEQLTNCPISAMNFARQSCGNNSKLHTNMIKKHRKSRRPQGNAPIRRVAVLVDTSTMWGRSIIRGIHDYSRSSGRWLFFVEARGMEEMLEVPANWQVEGVLARVSRHEMIAQLDSLKVPVVNVSGIELPGADYPRVTTNMRTSAQLAVAHFLERGFKNFAYFSLMGLPYVSNQQDAFSREVEKRGCKCFAFGVGTHLGAEPDWAFDLNKLAIWLKELPKPIAIFTWNASSAREVLFGCLAAKILVPEEVAVLSGADDDLLCQVSHIPISAIMPAAVKLGFEAAHMLDQLMRGGPKSKRPKLIDPMRVIARHSTDTLAINNQIVVRALNFIRAQTTRPLQVDDVAAHAGTSRRVLERRFTEILGRTPADEIRRVHLDEAKKLLRETTLSIPEVAEAAGFGSPEYMSHVFRTQLKRTPRDYRARMSRNH